eukprot:scaffold1007_cov183-Chaetoceros_neogracile.AAC.4
MHHMNNEHAWMEDGFYSAVPIRPKAQIVLLLYLQNTDPMGSFGLFLHSGTHILSLVLKTKDYQTPEMKSIVNNVHFNVVAREWRCKWDAESSLVECQTALTTVLDQVKDVKGVKDVQRVVCGGCKDFKVIVSLDEALFGEWEESAFAPEAEFLKRLKAITGVSGVETQTYTLMSMME